MTQQDIILSRLSHGPARRSELVHLTGAGHSSLAAQISRLRLSGWDIICKRSMALGDPRYELLNPKGQTQHASD